VAHLDAAATIVGPYDAVLIIAIGLMRVGCWPLGRSSWRRSHLRTTTFHP
jgi:hypothetical protein